MGWAASLIGIEPLILIGGLEIYKCHQDLVIAAIHRTAARPVNSRRPDVPMEVMGELSTEPYRSGSSDSSPCSCRVKRNREMRATPSCFWIARLHFGRFAGWTVSSSGLRWGSHPLYSPSRGIALTQ
jgi:hypothetical protein